MLGARELLPRSRFVRSETDTLKISNGDWLLVRRRLNHGERHVAFTRMYQAGADGEMHANPLQVSLHKIVAYLIDWSFTDDAGPVLIKGQPVETVIAALNALDEEDFAEIRDAIDAHEVRIIEARAQEKKLLAGETPSPAISESPSDAGGVSSGFVN